MFTTNSQRTPRSLLARGVDYLSRREHSRLELYRKLMRHLAEGETADDVEEVLNTLEARGYLDNSRYAQARVRGRLSRYGNQRLAMELREAGVDNESIQEALADALPEIERAREIYRKKFHDPISDSKDRDKRVRFLAARGFSFSVISKILSESQTFETEF